VIIETLTPGKYTGTILLADISGYTVFLEDVKQEHADDAFADGQIPYAYGLLSTLLGGIAEGVDPPFTLVKFEGDAVFAVGEDGAIPKGPDLITCIRECYGEFVSRMDEAGLTWTCSCNACEIKKTLDLKFVVHHGSYIVQSIGTHMDVMGPDITIAHRLLKNTAVSQVGAPAYALFTEATEAALGLDLDDGIRFTEPIDGAEPVDAVAIPLGV
jgi:class 3 adenylate cyclase